MQRWKSPRSAQVACLLVLSLAGCAARTSTVPDLPGVKQQVREYHDSGRYEADIAKEIDKARRILEKRAAAGGKLAIVLDIDETSLSNWPYEAKADFGYDPETWHEWVLQAEATAIGPTLELYRLAQHKGVAVFFITGRKERERKATEQNLVAVGYKDWDGLILKPDDFKSGVSAAVYKAEERRKIQAQGYTIIVNVGDQRSDLHGGAAEAVVKLPNPFYHVP